MGPEKEPLRLQLTDGALGPAPSSPFQFNRSMLSFKNKRFHYRPRSSRLFQAQVAKCLGQDFGRAAPMDRDRPDPAISSASAEKS